MVNSLMGDMNIDLLKYQPHTYTCNYLDNIFFHGYLPTITKPTIIQGSPSVAHPNQQVEHPQKCIHFPCEM